MINRSAVLSTALSVLGILLIGYFVFLASENSRILFTDWPDQSDSFGGGAVLTLEPTGTFAVFDDRVRLALLASGTAACITAIVLGARNIHAGRNDHFSVSGVVFGIMGILWAGLLASGVI